MKDFLKKQWPLIGVGVVLALVGFYLYQSGEEVVPDIPPKPVVSGEVLKLKDVRYTQENPDGGVKWVLDAKEIKFSKDKSSLIFSEFDLRVEPEKRPVFRLQGKKGDYSSQTGNILLWGGLEGFSENGYRMVTDHVLINEKTSQMITDDQVKIFGPYFSVAGQGLNVDLKNETFKVLSRVTTVFDWGSLIK